jgi:hypothetical protein
MIYGAIYLLDDYSLCLYLLIYLRLVLFNVFAYFTVIAYAMVIGSLINNSLIM